MRAMVDGEKIPPEITPLQLAINTIPVSTAVCERLTSIASMAHFTCFEMETSDFKGQKNNKDYIQ